MSSGVQARDVSAWSHGTSSGAGSTVGIATGLSIQLEMRILMVCLMRLAMHHALDVVFVRGLTACSRSSRTHRKSST